ncbi:hypothetical protein NFI96_032975, partial [Prochilodus magdalenae]
ALDDPYEKFILQHLKHYGLFTGFSFWQSCILLNQEHMSVENARVHHLFHQQSQLVQHGNAPMTLWSQMLSIHLQTAQIWRGSQNHFRDNASFVIVLYKIKKKPYTIYTELCTRTHLKTSYILIDIFYTDANNCCIDPLCNILQCIVLEWDPPEPEPFYQQTGHERTPVPVGVEKGHTVYCIDSATKTSYFTRSRVGGRREPIKGPTSCANNQATSTLSFESRFESGNLQKAVQVGVYDYELTLRNDMYTTKHTQWFYFRVSNMKADVTYRFTIVNLMKSSSLYEAGMRPLVYSELAAWLKGEGWRRVGSNIRYYRNHIEKEGKALYSLTWTLQFPYENDTCYLAHCYPYTYSDLQCYLRSVMSDPVQAAYCKVRVLCRSLAGNAVYALTITAPCGTWQERRTKRAVVVTARVHPGETNGSWMMQGFLDFLLGDSPDARLLRETFVFKVVPMLNPDGVIVGNYRCSLTGCDLNRNYRTVLRDYFPCVWYTRNMVKRLLAEREIVLYCDFHGHSRKNNVFMYGCNDHKDASLHLQERIFPLMMSKNAKDKFSFRSCKFKMQKSKEGTSRIVMWRLGIRNSYTMESTFGGSSLGDRKGTHFSMGDLKSMGYHFCDTLLDFCDPDKTKIAHCLTELGALLRQEIRQKLGRDVDLDSLEGLSDIDLESSTSGSNSTESDGLPIHLLNCSDQNMKVKKKHLRSRKERNKLRQQRTQSASKIQNSNIKDTDPLLLNDDLVKVRIQDKAVTPEKDTKEKSQKVMSILKYKYIVYMNKHIFVHVQLVMRANQSGRSWIPHPTTRIGILDHATLWEHKPDKNPYMKAVSAACLRNGGLTDSCRRPVTEEKSKVKCTFTLLGIAYLCFSALTDETGRTMCHYASRHTQRQRQRQPLTITAVRHRFSSVPVQQYSLLFNSDVQAHGVIRGALRGVPLVTDHRQGRVVSEFLPARGLEPCAPAHIYPTYSANRQHLTQEGTVPASNVSFKYFIPEMQSTMGTLRLKHKSSAA